MEFPPLSLARKFLLWYLSPPNSPYANYNFTMDFSYAQAYLEQLNATEGQARVTVQHLLTAAIARVYREFPVVNAHVHGSRIIRHPHVGVAIPVDLVQRGDQRKEITTILIEKAELLSLRQITQKTRKRVKNEVEGEQENFIFKHLLPLAERLPHRLFRSALSIADRAARRPAIFRQMHKRFPITVVVTNPGAALSLPEGGLTRSASFNLPQRLFGVGSLLAVFPIQEEVIPIDGTPQIRPILPLGYLFDHRLFDAVICGRIMNRLFEILRNPALFFGNDGNTTP